MSGPVQPVAPSPQELARIQGNVAKMRAQGAPESDVLAYLQHEDSQPAPSMDTSLSLRNLGRSAAQGATFGFGDELGLTDRAKENAFKAAHGGVDMIAKILGGMAAPIAAVAAAPALGTTLGGAALLGGGVGLLNGIGDSEGDATDRLESGVKGGLLGAPLGMLGYGASKLIGGAAGALMDRMHPERAVARAASTVIDPGTAAKLAQVDKIAPGGASIATASVPSAGDKVSRMLPMLRAVGANPEAGASAEASMNAQTAALTAARKGLGKQMDALAGNIPVPAPGVVDAVKEVLGSKAPDVPANATTMSVQDARDALSRLRYAARQAAKRGTETNGPNLHDINIAKAALQDHIYTNAPGFADLDRPYSTVMEQLGQTDKALKTVQRSRANYGANDAYGATSGSLGGSLPSGRHGVTMYLLDKILTDKAGSADAVARLIAKPGGPEMVQGLLSQVPKASGLPKYGAPIAAATIPALRGLLSPTSP